MYASAAWSSGFVELRVVRAFVRIAVAEQARQHLLNEPRDVHRSDVFQRRDVGETRREFARQRRRAPCRARARSLRRTRSRRARIRSRAPRCCGGCFRSAATASGRSNRSSDRRDPTAASARASRTCRRRNGARVAARWSRALALFRSCRSRCGAPLRTANANATSGAVADAVRANDDVLRQARLRPPTW